MSAQIISHLDKATEHLRRGDHDAAFVEIERINKLFQGLKIDRADVARIEDRIQRLHRVADAVLRGVRHAIEQVRSAAELSSALHAYDQAGNRHRKPMKIGRDERF